MIAETPPLQSKRVKMLLEGAFKRLPLSEDTESALKPVYWGCFTCEKLSKWKNKLLFTGTLTVALWSRKWHWNVQQPKTSTAIAVQYMRTWFKEPISWLLLGYQPYYFLVLVEKELRINTLLYTSVLASMSTHVGIAPSLALWKFPCPVFPQPSLPLYFGPVF